MEVVGGCIEFGDYDKNAEGTYEILPKPCG